MRFGTIILAVSALILTSCGGGGGGSSAPSGGGGATNNAPIVSNPNSDQAAFMGFEFAYDFTQGGTTFTDADGNSLNYSVTFNPDNGEFSVNGTNINGRASETGDITVTVTASDGQAGVRDTFIISVGIQQTATQARFGGSIDLENLANYQAQTVPDYIRDANVVNSPVTDAGATLGRVLFYDVALSIDDTVACASCHQQAHAFGDPLTVSNGVQGGQTGRHATRLVNTIYSDELRFFWDERAVDLEDQVTRPIKDHNEHGFSGQGGRPDFDDLIIKLEGIDYYDELFRFVFKDGDITEARIQSALSQFVNSILSFDSKYDAGLAQAIIDNPGSDPSDPFDPVYFANFTNFTPDENQGKLLYMSDPVDMGAGCRRCHADPTFAVFEDSGHIGLISVANNPGAVDFTNTRSPSLRDVFKPNGTPNGPFMHDGSRATMRAVIDFYDDIPVPSGEPLRTDFMNSIDQQLIAFDDTVELNLTNTEKDQIIAFLRTITGSNIYTDSKWSSPF